MKIKTLGVMAALLCGFVSSAKAVTVYNAPLVNESALAYSNTYTLNLNDRQVNQMSMQAIYSSATIAAVTVDMTAFALAGTAITGTNAFTTGLPVLYTSTVSVGGLTTGSTYYTAAATSSGFSLAKTSTGAVAGAYITFTSTTAGSGYSIKFAPLAISGTPSFKYQVSNDGSNWSDLTLTGYGVAFSSTTISSYTNPSASAIVDIGPINYSWFRVNVIAPTQGGLKLTVTPNAKR